MEITERDVKMTHYGDHYGAFIECTPYNFLEVQDHIAKSSKLMNKILKLIDDDKKDCECQQQNKCPFCIHRMQMKRLLI